MRIGIIYDSVDREGLDCSKPEYGNPGIGGTQYCFLMLIRYLSFLNCDEIFVYQYGNLSHNIEMPTSQKIEYRNGNSICCCVDLAKNDNVDVLLFSSLNVVKLAKKIDSSNLNCAVWVHNWMRSTILSAVRKSKAIKRCIFLVKEQYDYYIDDEVIKKSIFIHNMFEAKHSKVRDFSTTKKNVTYVGALIKGKGFHALAKIWKKIIKKEPSAELHVIGSGSLYGDHVNFGKLGIADKKYEDSFYKFVTDKKGRVLPSIHFHGLLGVEKNDILTKTKVGIVNPTAKTEICPLSALEMEAACIPVVSKNKNGLPDVVINRQTGFLIQNSRQLYRKIIFLLKNDDVNIEMGIRAREFVCDRFNPNKLALEWRKELQCIIEDTYPIIKVPKTNLFVNLKYLRKFSFFIKKFPLFRFLPSIVQIEGKIKKIFKI